MSWGRRGTAFLSAGALAFIVALALGPLPSRTSTTAGQPTAVIVMQTSPGRHEAQRAVRRLGGTVQAPLSIIHGFRARVPATELAELSRAPGVRSVTPDTRVELLQTTDPFDAGNDGGSMYQVAAETKALDARDAGITGRGIDVALIDSGVAPVEGLTAPGKIVNGPDLSFESQAPNLRYLDTFGHGTHMAGIIAGKGDGIDTPDEYDDPNSFMGMAPDARIVNVKVAAHSGATDVSQVIAAVDWVVQHRNDSGLNIRVLNLSFGTNSIQDYRLDPLAYAAEVAWRKGIVVVVAAGNSQYGTSRLNDPAYDPNLLAVGAADPRGTTDRSDDVVPSWSASGGTRGPDLVAPGRSLVSLRVPGALVDRDFPEARVGERFFRGSGTSQAAAVVSGAAALLLDKDPSLTPDEVKGALTSTASTLPNVTARAQGAGLLDVEDALEATPESAPTAEPATGTGSLEESRGVVHVTTDDGTRIAGEVDIMGQRWDPSAWASAAGAETSWDGGDWNARTWTGACMCGTSWAPLTWAWRPWATDDWASATRSPARWSSASWSSASWSSASWSSASWSSASWSTARWGGPPLKIQ